MPRRVNGFDLTPREKCFINAYIAQPWNATAAAIAAGYSSGPGARVTASRLLQKPNVKAAIAAAQVKITDMSGISVARVLSELALLGFANMADFLTSEGPERHIDLSNVTREQMAAISEYTSETYVEKDEHGKPRSVHRVRLKLHDKRGPLIDIGKHLGMFTAANKSEVQITDTDGEAAKEELRRKYERLAAAAPKPNGSDSSVIDSEPGGH
jgi:phage terminase small subunit